MGIQNRNVLEGYHLNDNDDMPGDTHNYDMV